MMKYIYYVLIFLIFTSCSKHPENNSQQYVALCQQGKGCEIAKIPASPEEIDALLKKQNFWTKASDSATLVIEGCLSKIVEKQTVLQIHQSYGGAGNPKEIEHIDILNHLKTNGCFSCPNDTKKISFYVDGGDHKGNGFFYLNLKDKEAYMSNAGFQQLMAGQDGANEIVIDQFIRNQAIEAYSIAEGEKFHSKMPIGTNMSVIKEDAINEQKFKTDFKASGKTRVHERLKQTETEYTGLDDDGKMIHFWLTPVQDVCLAPGKFDLLGFFNLGYIAVDGTTYLVTEISGSGFMLKLTDIGPGTYNFNPSGYKSISF